MGEPPRRTFLEALLEVGFRPLRKIRIVVGQGRPREKLRIFRRTRKPHKENEHKPEK